MIPLFDLHCDTLYEIYKNRLSVGSPALHVSLLNAHKFDPYVQLCAIWSDFRLTDEEAYESYKKCLQYSKQLGLSFSCSLTESVSPSLILSVEDARLLNKSIKRLDSLYYDGVRTLTLNWKGDNCIGGGWDTSNPLTPFGIDLVHACANKGVAIDLSHSSYETQLQVVKLAYNAGFSPFYSHSNSFSVCQHKRNVTDILAKEVSNLNGLIGLSMCTEHLSNSEPASTYTLVKHAYHFLSLGCERNLALGCDFDGISSLPIGISDVGDMAKIYDIFLKEFGKEISSRIFYQNSYDYFSKLLNGR